MNGFRRLYSKGFQGVCLRLLEKKYWQQRASPTLDIIEPLLIGSVSVFDFNFLTISLKEVRSNRFSKSRVVRQYILDDCVELLRERLLIL